jgi:predicted transposase YdaD
MFGFNDIDLKQTRFYQQAVSEGLREGMAKGMEKGMRKGIVQGEAALLLRQLERGFGPVSLPARQRIADADALLVYGERVLDAKNLEDIFVE